MQKCLTYLQKDKKEKERKPSVCAKKVQQGKKHELSDDQTRLIWNGRHKQTLK